MKTAGRENPNRWAAKLSNRATGAEGQNRSCSIKWAAKVKKFQPWRYFFLDFPFYRTNQALAPYFRVESPQYEPLFVMWTGALDFCLFCFALASSRTAVIASRCHNCVSE